MIKKGIHSRFFGRKLTPDVWLTWFIRYIYFWKLQFLNNVIIIKSKVLLLRHRWLSCIAPKHFLYCSQTLPVLLPTLPVLLPNTFKLFDFQSFAFEPTWWTLFQNRVMCNKLVKMELILDVSTKMRGKGINSRWLNEEEYK